MTKSVQKNTLYLIAFVVPTISTAFGTQVAYWTGNNAYSSIWTYIGMLFGTIIGGASIINIPTQSKINRVLTIAVYLATMIVLLNIVAGVTGCFNGDCL